MHVNLRSIAFKHGWTFRGLRCCKRRNVPSRAVESIIQLDDVESRSHVVPGAVVVDKDVVIPSPTPSRHDNVHLGWGEWPFCCWRGSDGVARFVWTSIFVPHHKELRHGIVHDTRPELGAGVPACQRKRLPPRVVEDGQAGVCCMLRRSRRETRQIQCTPTTHPPHQHTRDAVQCQQCTEPGERSTIQRLSLTTPMLVQVLKSVVLYPCTVCQSPYGSEPLVGEAQPAREDGTE